MAIIASAQAEPARLECICLIQKSCHSLLRRSCGYKTMRLVVHASSNRCGNQRRVEGPSLFSAQSSKSRGVDAHTLSFAQITQWLATEVGGTFVLLAYAYQLPIRNW